MLMKIDTIPEPHRVTPSKGGAGRKVYSCDECDKVFATSGHLARHGRVHSGVKPYACAFPGCTMTSSRKDNLASHYRIHFDVRTPEDLAVEAPGKRRRELRVPRVDVGTGSSPIQTSLPQPIATRRSFRVRRRAHSVSGSDESGSFAVSPPVEVPRPPTRPSLKSTPRPSTSIGPAPLPSLRVYPERPSMNDLDHIPAHRASTSESMPNSSSSFISVSDPPYPLNIQKTDSAASTQDTRWPSADFSEYDTPLPALSRPASSSGASSYCSNSPCTPVLQPTHADNFAWLSAGLSAHDTSASAPPLLGPDPSSISPACRSPPLQPRCPLEGGSCSLDTLAYLASLDTADAYPYLDMIDQCLPEVLIHKRARAGSGDELCRVCGLSDERGDAAYAQV